MIDARLPQHVAAVHAPIAAQNVLQRVVERVAHMQIAGDVRRRNDDAKRLRRRPVGAAGPEGAGLLPKRGGAAFGRSEVERFVHHGILVRATPGGDALEIGWRPSERRWGYGRRRRKRHGRYKCIAAVEVNARRGRERLFPSARDPLDFRPHQPLDDGRQVLVQPLLEHRPQHVAHHAVGELGAANLETGRQGPERQGRRLVRLGRQQRLLASLRPRSAGRRFGFDRLRPAPDDRRRVRVRRAGTAPEASPCGAAASLE